MSKGKFALGAIFGAAIGAVAGILTAPKSGKETRAEIKSKAEKMKTEAMKKAEMVGEKASDMTEKIKSEAGDLRDRTERAVEGAKKGFFDKDK